MKSSAIPETVGGLLILLFVYTAISKLLDFERFSNILHQSPLISNYSAAVARTLPVIELAISLLLLVPAWRLTGLYFSFALLVVFTGYLAVMVSIKSQHLPCSCGGVISNMSWKQHVLFNLFFILLCIAGIISLERHAPSRVKPTPP